MEDDDAAPVKPLTGEEQAVWRALMGLLIVLPRKLASDMEDTGGLSSSEYVILMHLSEAPEWAMRMIDLAERSRLTQSGATRIVERLCQAGLVMRRRSEYDGRGQVAVLTDAGFTQVEATYPAHLASVRRRVFDRLAGLDLGPLAEALDRLAVDDRSHQPTDRATPERRSQS